MGASWEITKYIQNKVLKVVKLVIQNSNFIFLTYDEVTTMDNTSWANVHGYIVYDWCQISILLNVQQVLSGSSVDSLVLLIMNSLMT
jgi:hypothetical protein